MEGGGIIKKEESENRLEKPFVGGEGRGEVKRGGGGEEKLGRVRRGEICQQFACHDQKYNICQTSYTTNM